MKILTNYLQEHLVGNILWGYIFTKDNLRRIKEIIELDDDTKEYSKNTYGYLNSIDDGDDVWRLAKGYKHKPKNNDEYENWKIQCLSSHKLSERLKNIDDYFTDVRLKNKYKEGLRDDLYIRNLQITAALNPSELTRAYEYMKKKMKNAESRKALDKLYAKLSGKTPSKVDNKKDKKDKKK
jgi:hypothetical protein